MRNINYTLVDGFSCATRCTPEGRALMNLDYQQLLHKVEAISHCRITAKQRHFTETYIRAYYFTEDELETWLPKNRNYSKKQLTALVTQSGASLSKKTKQKLLLMIEDM